MKLQDYTLSPANRKDINLLSVLDDIANIINNGRYQMRVVSAIPTYVGEEGEHLLYVSGTVRRLYWYDITNSTWQFINWNTSGFAQSTIVATAQLTGQTGNIVTTTLYTPSAAGLFRISVYQICTTTGTGTLSSTIGWTDAAGAKTTSPAGTVDLSSTSNGATGMTFLSTTASAITYATAIAGKVGSPQYAIYLVLEALA